MEGAVNTLRFLPKLCLLIVAGIPVAARAGEPSRAEKAPTRYFTLDIADAYLEFEGVFTYRRVGSGTSRPDQRNREWGFRERFGLNVGGSVIDPRFITYHADFSFGLAQDHYKESIDSFHQSDTDRGVLLEYDARLNFLPGKLLSGSLYGVRRNDRINRRFQPTLKERHTGFGTSWVYAHQTLPMELSYDFRRTDREGNRDGSDDEEFIDNTFRYGVDWVISERNKFEFSYEHTETAQEYQGSRGRYETTRDLFLADHDLQFGSDGRHSLRTGIRWQEESGDFARNLFEIGPHLTLQHSDDFQTSYRYQFNRERYAGLDVETQRLDWQAVHQMYTNLTTTVDLFGLYEDIEDDINTTQYGASVDWQYNRRNQWGHLYANLALAYDTEDVSGDDGQRLVLDESAAFRDPIDNRLANRNIIRASIVVTDATNRRVYTSGFDYFVYSMGNVTRVRRVPTGLIADGDTVLVDYRYNTPTDGKLDTLRADFSIEQRFAGGSTPYYRFSYRNQEDDASFGFERRADRTDHHRLGVKYETKRYTLGTEYEVFDDSVEPYDAFHVNGVWHLIRGADQSADASARVSRLMFDGGDADRNVTFVDVSLDHRRRLTDSVSTVERLSYRYERDSDRGNTQGWDVTAGLDFTMGELSGELTLEYDSLDLPGSEEDDYGVYFRVRRDFPDVLARR